MCKWGDVTHMGLNIPAHLSHSGKGYRKDVGVDSCIALIVKALNDGGVPTIASCCGHGQIHGSIILEDGRELVIMSTEDREKHFEQFPHGIHGDPRTEATGEPER